MQKLIAYCRLMRPANILTALANILAGYAIALGSINSLPGSTLSIESLILLLITTIGLYGGGVVFNDVFDAKLDATERPERPIPRGIVTQRQAALLGTILFVMALIAAYQVSSISFLIAVSICVLCFSYDGYAKHRLLLGPINMGLCRALNLLLGMSIFEQALKTYWFIAFLPFIFILAITLTSKGEVQGSDKPLLKTALVFYIVTVAGMAALTRLTTFHGSSALPFLITFALLAFFPLIKAIKNSGPDKIRQAVKSGILSLVVLDAALAAGFVNIYYAVLILSLLPLSIIVAKKFAVT